MPTMRERLLLLIRWLDRARYHLVMGLIRLLLRTRGFPQHRLEGECVQCGRCCVRPSIQTNWLYFRLRSVRAVKMAWHRRLNGWELTEEVPEHKAYVFRCTHYDESTRTCAAYSSRPAMCRDYPRLTLYTMNPSVFDECGFRVVHLRAAAVRRKIEGMELPQQQAEKIRRALDLGDE